MKKIIFILCIAGLFNAAQAQLVPKSVCPTITVDILDGIVNELSPASTPGQIKLKLPCFTSTEAEGSGAKCGGTVFYKDRDIYFYTDRDYIEIGEKFKGNLSIPLLGASRTGLFKWLGLPKLKDPDWEAFQTQYGTLVLHYNKNNKVYLIQFSTRHTETLSLCE